MAIDLPPDAVGFAAGFGPKDKPLPIPPSHVLTLIYTLLYNLQGVGPAFADAYQNRSVVALGRAVVHVEAMNAALGDLVSADFRNACELVPAMDEDELDAAFDEFVTSRMAEFVNVKTGTPIFEKLPMGLDDDDPDDLDEYAKLS